MTVGPQPGDLVARRVGEPGLDRRRGSDRTIEITRVKPPEECTRVSAAGNRGEIIDPAEQACARERLQDSERENCAANTAAGKSQPEEAVLDPRSAGILVDPPPPLAQELLLRPP